MIKKAENSMSEIDTAELDKMVGARIHQRRKMLKMSQDNIASMLGITFQQFQKYETGESKISCVRLYLVAKILRVDIRFFFEDIRAIEDKYASLSEANSSVAEDCVQYDPIMSPETVRLTTAYWKIKDAAKRHSTLEFIETLG